MAYYVIDEGILLKARPNIIIHPTHLKVFGFGSSCPGRVMMSVVNRQIRFTDLDPSPLAARLDQEVVSINRLIAAATHRRSALIRDSSDLRRLVIERWMTPL